MSQPARRAEDLLAAPGYARRPLGEFLSALAAPEPAPGGGAAAAVSVALAAALAAMAARLSGEQLYDAAALAERADRLRERALRLAADDAAAYEALLEARRLPGGACRDQELRHATERAADVPLEISESAREAAALAARLAGEGNPNLRGDSVTAAYLAEGAAHSAAELVSLNVGEEDWRSARARSVGEDATALARCAGRHRTHETNTRPPPRGG